jgi:phenylacetic acid degradation operon negative regulatory protein
LKAWSGGWLSIFVGHLARSNKTQVRSTERSLQLHGFAETQPGLWLRPDNLRASLSAVFKSLTALGLASNSIGAEINRFEPPDSINPAQLWHRAALERLYRAHIATLATSRDKLATLEHRQAAGETLLIGRRVTRDVLLDPLLPDELVDAELRRAMIDAMKEYDKVGKSLWREFFLEHERQAQNPAA